MHASTDPAKPLPLATTGCMACRCYVAAPEAMLQEGPPQPPQLPPQQQQPQRQALLGPITYKAAAQAPPGTARLLAPLLLVSLLPTAIHCTLLPRLSLWLRAAGRLLRLVGPLAGHPAVHHRLRAAAGLLQRAQRVRHTAALVVDRQAGAKRLRQGAGQRACQRCPCVAGVMQQA